MGAKNANHSSHYTAANSSHIRIAPKGDNLGLGAKKGRSDHDETFGLTLLQGIFGRINGKDEAQLKKEETAQRDIKLAIYNDRRWGGMRFVSGGFLVGDKIEDIPREVLEGRVQSQAAPEETTPSKEEEVSSESSIQKTEPTVLVERKKESKSKRKKEESERDAKEERKSKKRKQPEPDEVTTEAASTESTEDERAERKRRKAEKKQRKAQRQARREEKKARKEAKKAEKAKDEDRSKADRSKKKKKQKKIADAESDSSSSSFESSTEAETTPATLTPNLFSGRQAVRQRYIQQKRMASMDPQALKEIFMIQAKA